MRDLDFQNDGAFDPRIYDLFIGRGRNREAEKVAYEKWLRLQILGAKVLDNVASLAKVSDAELQDYFRLAREAVQVDYLVVNPDTFMAKAKPTDADLKEYLQKHEAEFRVPERVKAQYLLVRSQDFLKQAEASPQDVDDYIQNHKSELTRPLEIRVREIFLAFPPKANAAAKQQVKEKAEELLNQARQGQDFAQLAKTSSQDEASRQQGGELAPVTRGKKGDAWDKVAFALAPGETGLAQTDKGYHVILMEGVEKREPLPEVESQARATQKVKEAKSQELARDEAKQLQSGRGHHFLYGGGQEKQTHPPGNAAVHPDGVHPRLRGGAGL